MVLRIVRNGRTSAVFGCPILPLSNRSFGLMLALCVALTTNVRGQIRTAANETSAAIIRMDDDFAYQIVDYGLGAVEACDREPVRNGSVFWLRVRLTNESVHLLASPRYFERITVTDNWGNGYRRTLFCGLNKKERYKPGESIVEAMSQ
jgi:hypothetical protein